MFRSAPAAAESWPAARPSRSPRRSRLARHAAGGSGIRLGRSRARPRQDLRSGRCRRSWPVTSSEVRCQSACCWVAFRILVTRVAGHRL